MEHIDFIHVLYRRPSGHVADIDETNGNRKCLTRLEFFGDQKTTASIIDWQALYPFEETEPAGDHANNRRFGLADFYSTAVQELKEKVKDYTDTTLAGRERMILWYRNYNFLIGWRVSQTDEIVYMKNGYLTSVQPQISEDSIEEIGDAVLDFSRYLEETGIPLYYINAGSKVNPEDKELYPRDIEQEFPMKMQTHF